MLETLASAPFLIAVGVAFAGSILGGLSGFGAGAIVAPFILPLFGEKGVFPILATAMLVGNLARFWVYRSSIDVAVVRRLAVPLLPGIILGVTIHGLLSAQAVSLLIGALLIGSIPLRRLMVRSDARLGPKGSAAVAFGAGVIGGNAPGGGIIVVSLLLGSGLTGATLIGTDAALGILLSFVNATLFGGLGLLSIEGFVAGLSLGAAMIPGAYTARWLMKRLTVGVHLAIMEFFVAASGLVFLVKGLPIDLV